MVDRSSPDAPKDGAPEGPDALGVDTPNVRKDVPTRPEVAPADIYRADLYLPEAGIDGNTAAPDTRDGRSITGSEVGNGDIYGIRVRPDGPMRIDGSNVDGADGARDEGVTDGPMFNE